MKIERIKSKIIKLMRAPDEYRDLNDMINKELLSINIDKISDLSQATILDCGCGNGNKLLSIKKSFPGFKEYKGIDNYLPAIKSCEKHSKKGLEFIYGDCLSMPIGDKSVDVIISNQVIEHISQYEIYLKELKRILKPEGIIILSTPNFHCPKNTILKMFGQEPILRWGNIDGKPPEDFRGHTQEFSEIELIMLLKSHSFVIKDLIPILPCITLNGNILFNLYSIAEYLLYKITKPFVEEGYSKNTNLVCTL